MLKNVINIPHFRYALAIVFGLCSGLLVYFFETGPGVTGFEIFDFDFNGNGVSGLFALQSVLISGFIFGIATSFFASLLMGFRRRMWFSLVIGALMSYGVAALIIPPMTFFLATFLFFISSLVGSIILSFGVLFSGLEVDREKMFRKMLIFPLPAVVIAIFISFSSNGFTFEGILEFTESDKVVFAFLHPFWQISTLLALASSIKNVRGE